MPHQIFLIDLIDDKLIESRNITIHIQLYNIRKKSSKQIIMKYMKIVDNIDIILAWAFAMELAFGLDYSCSKKFYGS